MASSQEIQIAACYRGVLPAGEASPLQIPNTGSTHPLPSTKRGVGFEENVPCLCRKAGFSEGHVLQVRARYGGMDVPHAKRQHVLESDNGRLKKLLAEAHLDIHERRGVFG